MKVLIEECCTSHQITYFRGHCSKVDLWTSRFKNVCRSITCKTAPLQLTCDTNALRETTTTQTMLSLNESNAVISRRAVFSRDIVVKRRFTIRDSESLSKAMKLRSA